jgi:hypothetical protein
MTSGDNDLSAFTPVILTEQTGIARTQAAINAATSITSFQDLLEELHVLAVGLSGAQSYNGYAGGNLFTFEAGELKTNFATVNVDATVASKIAYDFATNTLTIKASNLVGNDDVAKWNNSIGAVNLLNGATIQGVYQDSTGTSTVLTISGFDAGSAVYVEDNNEVQKFYSASATGMITVYIPPTATGSWYYAVEKYGNQRQSDFFTFSGGFKDIVVKALVDVGITDTLSNVQNYTTLSNTEQIYDATAVYRLSVPGIKYGQLVLRDGEYLDFDIYNVVFKDDASDLVFVDISKNPLGFRTRVIADGGTFEAIDCLTGYPEYTIFYKSLVVNETSKYTAVKTLPPSTIAPDNTEIINVLIEDANGDSQISILGGDNLGYELWKVTTATATDDYEDGELLTTLPDNTESFRFIGISGFDIVGRDVSSGVRRRSSMLKGDYTQSFYVGDQIQLSTNAPQLVENNQKLDLLILKVDAQKKPLTLPQFIALK